MLIYERSLHESVAVAHDGVAGKVRDVLFDDVTWVVRHVVVRTGSRFAGRTVVVSPAVLTLPGWFPDRVALDLDREQVGRGPGIDSAKPVSVQEGMRLHGREGAMAGFMYDGFAGALMVPTASAERELAESPESRPAGIDPHLRSAEAVRGYRVRLPFGETLGHVEDFIVDTTGWNITHIVIASGGWPRTLRIMIPAGSVGNIFWEEKVIEMRLPPDASRTGVTRATRPPGNRTRSRQKRSVSPPGKRRT